MYHYQIIDIKNIEPLKIGAKGHQSIFEEPAKDYIPGSTIRGAIIAQLIQSGLFEKAKEEILLSMECYNAYPCRDNLIYIQAPLNLRKDKHGWREAKNKVKYNTDEIFSLSDIFVDKEKAKNHIEYKYLTIDKSHKILRGIKVAKEYRLHHSTIKGTNTDEANGEKDRENLFRYEAISPGQCFRTIIRYKKELEEVMRILFEKTSIIYLGGSKGSGYGKSEICGKKDNCYNNYKDAKKTLGMEYPLNEDTQELVITCLSDCIFRNKLGQPCNHIPTEELERLTNNKYRFKLKEQHIQAGQAEGYNTKWQAKYPRESTVKAGSVIKYEIQEDKTGINIRTIADELEQNLIGGRTQDGYGWIGVNIDFPTRIYVAVQKSSDNCKDSSITEDWLGKIRNPENEREKSVKNSFDIIVEGLRDSKERWLKMLCKRLLENPSEEGQRILIISKELNNNKIKNIEDMLDKLINKGYKTIDMSDRDKIILSTSYANSNESLSLAQCDFRHLWDYMNGSEKLIEADGYNVLKNFVDNKLNSKKGILFYSGEQSRKQFIAELLKNGLYISRRGGNNGDEDKQASDI